MCTQEPQLLRGNPYGSMCGGLWPRIKAPGEPVILGSIPGHENVDHKSMSDNREILLARRLFLVFETLATKQAEANTFMP